MNNSKEDSPNFNVGITGLVLIILTTIASLPLSPGCCNHTNNRMEQNTSYLSKLDYNTDIKEYKDIEKPVYYILNSK